MDELKKPARIAGKLSEIWDELALQVRPTIGEAGMEAMCSQVMRMRDAQARINSEGLVVADRSGNPVPHPALAVEKTAGAEVRAWMKQFRVLR